MRSFILGLMATFYFSLVISCSNRIIPPLQVEDPVKVYLVDHGRHPSLILTRSDGNLVRYAYGDWRWYALGKETVWGAMHAILWPSQATLGRREFSENPAAFRRGGPIREGFVQIYPFQVERRDADKLQKNLDAAYDLEAQAMTYNPRYGLEFVPYSPRYWFFRHSNRVMGHWLRELGCQVQGSLIFSDWKLVDEN